MKHRNIFNKKASYETFIDDQTTLHTNEQTDSSQDLIIPTEVGDTSNYVQSCEWVMFFSGFYRMKPDKFPKSMMKYLTIAGFDQHDCQT